MSPERGKLNDVIKMIHEFKGHDVMESIIAKTKNRFTAKMIEDRFSSQMTLDTAVMI